MEQFTLSTDVRAPDGICGEWNAEGNSKTLEGTWMVKWKKENHHGNMTVRLLPTNDS